MKLIRRVIYLYCCVFFKLYAATFSQKTILYSLGVGQPIATSTADTLDKGQIGISLRGEYYPNFSFSDSVLLLNPDAENLDARLNGYFLLSYGVQNYLSIGANLPYIDNISFANAQFNEQTEVARVLNIGSSYGLGDTNIFILSQVLDQDNTIASFSILSGVNAPTGKTTARDSTGALFSASDQPGSGAWSPFVGLILSKDFDKFSLSSNLIYTQGIEGTQKTTLGSVFDYNFATVLELYRNEKTKLEVDGIMEFNGEYVAKDNTAGVVQANSGGNSIYLLPGIRTTLYKNYSGYFGVNIPVSQHYYGIQAKNKYGITMGIDLNI